MLVVTPEVTNAHRDVAIAERLGLSISLWTSDDDWHTVGATWRAGELDVLIVNAVRSNLPRLLERLMAQPAPPVSLLLLEHVQACAAVHRPFNPLTAASSRP